MIIEQMHDLETNGLMPVTREDMEIIVEVLEKDIKLRVDEYGKVWNEARIYIADVTILER